MIPLSPDALAASSSITVNLGSTLSKPSDAVLIILGVTVLSVVPSLFILLTGFVRITIVLSLARQAYSIGRDAPRACMKRTLLVGSAPKLR